MTIFAYLVWLPVSLLIFKFSPRQYGPWICLLGGWVLLPPAVYPMPLSDGFPFWITGGSLPSNVLINKAWVAPLATCAASLLFDGRRWWHTSFNVWDALIVGFCLWPIVQDGLIGNASPNGWVSSLYLAGSWALPWWLGRLYLRSREDVTGFALVFAGVILLLLPFAIVEGIGAMRVHTLLLGEHPFAADGVERYLGYRPQGLFEHGNQYGLWCGAAAVAAIWLVRQGKLAPGLAAILVAMTVASQSAGAIGLLILGAIALIWGGSFALVYRFGIWALLFAVIAAGLLVAGLIPLREIVEQTGAGQALLDAIRSTGRGSFAWRVSQDLKAAPLLREHLLMGHGQWDWFLPLNSRPWDFPLLVIGQFGLIGLGLLVLPMMRAAGSALGQAASGNEAAKLAGLLIVIAGIDAALNSFLLWPFIVLASPFAIGTGKQPGYTTSTAERPDPSAEPAI